MCVCILDGKMLENKEMLHDILADTLGFPDWYGRNLDALHDCLMDLYEETEIRVQNENDLIEHLGNYAVTLLKVIAMSAEENGKINFFIEN